MTRVTLRQKYEIYSPLCDVGGANGFSPSHVCIGLNDAKSNVIHMAPIHNRSYADVPF